MIYEYLCSPCDKLFDVVKAADLYREPEICPDCGKTAERQWSSRIQLHHTKVQEAEYNPGLGCITKNRQHREEICRQKGLEEVGNEKPEAIHKHFDKRREEAWDRGWAETTKEWVGDGT